MLTRLRRVSMAPAEIRIADVLVGFLQIPFRYSAIIQVLVCRFAGECCVRASLCRRGRRRSQESPCSSLLLLT